MLRSPRPGTFRLGGLVREAGFQDHAQRHVPRYKLAGLAIASRRDGQLLRHGAGRGGEVELVGDDAAWVVVNARHPGRVERLVCDVVRAAAGVRQQSIGLAVVDPCVVRGLRGVAVVSDRRLTTTQVSPVPGLVLPVQQLSVSGILCFSVTDITRKAKSPPLADVASSEGEAAGVLA
jgi:hypothetical protein